MLFSREPLVKKDIVMTVAVAIAKATALAMVLAIALAVGVVIWSLSCTFCILGNREGWTQYVVWIRLYIAKSNLISCYNPNSSSDKSFIRCFKVWNHCSLLSSICFPERRGLEVIISLNTLFLYTNWPHDMIPLHLIIIVYLLMWFLNFFNTVPSCLPFDLQRGERVGGNMFENW